MDTNKSTFRQDKNQLIYTRMLNAPRELVWEVWTTPEHIKEWFGPEGFSLNPKSFEAGKHWKFTLDGFGQSFDNNIEYLEFVKPTHLVYKHSNGDGTLTFFVHVSFEDMGQQTLLTMRSVFESEELIAELNRKVNAIKGGQQTLDKLERYLSTIQ